MTEKFKLPILVQGTKKTNSSGAARVNNTEYATDAQELAKLIAEWIILDADKSFLELHIGNLTDGKADYHDPESAMVASIKVDVSLVCQGLRGVGSAEKRHGQEPGGPAKLEAEIEVLVCSPDLRGGKGVPENMTVLDYLKAELTRLAPEAKIAVRGTSQKTKKGGVPYSSYFVSQVYSERVTPFLERFFEGSAEEVERPRYKS